MNLLIKLRVFEILQLWFVGIFACFICLPYFYNSASALFLAALLFHIIGTYFLNDCYDWESDLRNPRRSGFLVRPKALGLFGFGFLLASTVVAFLISTQLLCIFLVLNFLGYAYSAPPLRLKGKKPFPALIHGLSGFFYFLSAPLAAQIEFRSSFLFYAAFWAVVFASGSFVNETLDKATDRINGDSTVGQLLQEKTAKLAIAALHSLSAILVSVAYGIDQLYFSVAAVVILLAAYLYNGFMKSSDLEITAIRKQYRITFALMTLLPFTELFY